MIKEISVRELQKLIDAGAELVDVREQEELKEGAIDGGKNWPLSSFGLRQSDISQRRPTIFYCRSGMRSMKAAEIAADWTQQDIYTLNGGFLDYSKDETKDDSKDESKAFRKGMSKESAQGNPQ